ncbi:MAG TPA: nuclear transport factor 2 family protein [Nitriliruptorales bacterium]
MRVPAHDDVDVGQAAAESRLARLDEDEPPAPTGDNGVGDTLDLTEAAADGIHVEIGEFDAYEVGQDDLDDLHGPADQAVVIDAFCEAFNARDLDGLFDLLADDCETPGLGNDCDNFAEAVEDLWERRPTSLLTRGELEGEPVAVLWEVGDTGAWWRVAPVLFDAVEDGQAGVVELSDDNDTLDAIIAEVPEDDLDEGSRWSEWDEGASV